MEGNWLPHLEGCIPRAVSADKLSMYTIALEGWRRGLPLKFYTVKYGSKVEINYSFTYKEKEYKFAVSKGEDVPKEAMRICKDKGLTKEYLMRANVSVPKGDVFSKDVNNEKILQYAESIGYPVVLKPTNANLGKGVIPNIVNKEELLRSLEYVRNTLGFKEVILEQNIVGEEYRIYVIDGKVVAAMNRIPANIIGDGKRTIRSLISQKNIERKANPNFRGRLIKIDSEVRKYVQHAGYTLDSILKNGEQLFLRKNSNISSGGESIDVTDQLTEEQRKNAIAACQAIPGLAQCGVDMIIDDETNKGAIIELNTRPGIGGHLYPKKGKGRDIPKAIIDYYFPETKDKKIDHAFYFDYKSITSTLNSGLAKEVRIPAIPQGELATSVIYVKGNVQKYGYKRWIQNKALSHQLSGFVRDSSRKDSIQIVVRGKMENVHQLIEAIKKESPESVAMDVTDRNWSEPIKIGFELRTKREKRKTATKRVEKSKKETVQVTTKVEKNLTFSQKAYKKFGDTMVWKMYKKIKNGTKG